jgi:hypothetical protein
MKTRLICFGLTVLLIASCEKESNIKVYRVSKAPLEDSASNQSDSMPANAASPPASAVPPATAPVTMSALDSTAPSIKWKTPDGWTEVPPSSMRFASFNAAAPNGGKVDISIVTFPGDGGTDVDNVNRWRKQIGLAPIDDKEIANLVRPVSVGDSQFSALDMASGGARVIAAWTRRDGRSWFFKMSGPVPALEDEKPKFFDFLQSIDFHS